MREETKSMREALGEDMMYTADQKEVVFVYEGETAESAKHGGKHVVELKRKRPSWFPNILLTKKES